MVPEPSIWELLALAGMALCWDEEAPSAAMRNGRLRIAGDKANVFFVKPDGTQLLVAWYDRRNDTNNSMIGSYGRWGTIASNGDVTFGTEFKLNTTNFPPVFAGTLTVNTNQGHYDPVYPPDSANLHWWYPEWPDDPGEFTGDE